MATIIYNATQLQDMESDLAADYELGSDINCSGIANFDPIGSIGSQFTGSFDGKGYKITNLTIDRPTESWIGLFGYTNGGEIKNVGLENCDVTGKTFVGSLVGGGRGISFSNCWSTGAVSAIRGSVGGLFGYSYEPVSDCWSSCLITCTGGANDVSEVGGLIGTAASSVTRSYSTGNVVATSDGNIDQVGGFIGYSTSGRTNTQCYSTGDVSVTALGTVVSIGGFVGTGGDDTSNCYARGDITVSVGNTSLGDIGGFVGLSASPTFDNCYSAGLLTVTGGVPDIGGFCGDNYGTIADCFWDTETSGQASSDGGTGKTTAQMKSINTFQSAEWLISTIWNLISSCNNGYPCLIDVNICCVAALSNLVDQSIIGSKVTLEAIRNLEMQYGGKFLIDKSGNAVWQSRYHRNV